MLDWDQLRRQCGACTELSEAERSAAEEAFLILSKLFGGIFFEIQHPLYLFFINEAPWTKLWAIWFSKLLQSLENHTDFPSLVADLASSARFSERMTVLNMVERLMAAGFNIRLDMQIPVNGTPKKPDIFVQLDSALPGFFIEVSALFSSEKERLASSVSRKFFDTISPLNLGFLFSGRIERALSPMHLAEVLDKITETATRSRQNSSFETLEIEGIIHFAIGPQSAEEQVGSWARARGMKLQELSGPPYEGNELDRLANKLKREQEQLPSGTTNVVVIHAQPSAGHPGSLEHFRHVAQFLEEEVYKYPQVGFVAVIFDWLGLNSNDLHQWRDHFCSNRNRFEFISDTTMLLKNRFANPPMPLVLEKKLIQAFTT